MKENEKNESSAANMPLASMPTTSVGMAPGVAAGDSQAASFGKLAKRLTGITSNCLFTVIILVAGLGIGRQVLQWWSADAPPPSAKPLTAGTSGGGGNPSEIHLVQFGRQGWSMARREFRGSREAAAEQLRRDCRERIEAAAIPHEKPTEEQKNLLAALADSPAIEAELPRWQLFAVDKKNRSILVGIKPPLAKEVETGKEVGWQVVLWGIVLPKGEDRWSILLFTPSLDGGKAIPLLSDIPLPAKCRKMLSVQAVSGGAMVGFSGPGEPASWRAHFEKWFAKGGWKPVAAWQETPAAWYARYRGRSEERDCTVDVHFSAAENGGMSGMVIVEAEK